MYLVVRFGNIHKPKSQIDEVIHVLDKINSQNDVLMLVGA